MSEGRWCRQDVCWRLDCSWWVRPDDAENRVVDPNEAVVIVYPTGGGSPSNWHNYVTKCKGLGIAGTGL